MLASQHDFAVRPETKAANGPCAALPTVPGVGPKTAAAPMTLVGVSMFCGHDEPAAHAGLAPYN